VNVFWNVVSPLFLFYGIKCVVCVCVCVYVISFVIR